MDAIRTDKSNFTFLGPTPEVSDLPTELDREERIVWSVWKLTDEEREAIANGAQVKLGIFQEETVDPTETRCDGCGALWAHKRGVVTCGHCGHALVGS